jgi:hypothetical protein
VCLLLPLQQQQAGCHNRGCVDSYLPCSTRVCPEPRWWAASEQSAMLLLVLLQLGPHTSTTAGRSWLQPACRGTIMGNGCV